MTCNDMNVDKLIDPFNVNFGFTEVTCAPITPFQYLKVCAHILLDNVVSFQCSGLERHCMLKIGFENLLSDQP